MPKNLTEEQYFIQSSVTIHSVWHRVAYTALFSIETTIWSKSGVMRSIEWINFCNEESFTVDRLLIWDGSLTFISVATFHVHSVYHSDILKLNILSKNSNFLSENYAFLCVLLLSTLNMYERLTLTTSSIELNVNHEKSVNKQSCQCIVLVMIIVQLLDDRTYRFSSHVW